MLMLEYRASEANHFLAYVVIVLRSIGGPKQGESIKLFIPVDFEVTDNVGVFPSTPIIDFGTVTPNTPVLKFPLKVLNGYSRPVLVQNVSSSALNVAVNVDYAPARLIPDLSRKQTVAFVELDPSQLTSRQQLQGEIQVQIKGSNNIASVPYRLRYVSSNLTPISPSNLSFNCQEGQCDWHAPPRFISLVNTAKSQIILYSIKSTGCRRWSPYQVFLKTQLRALPAIFTPRQSHSELFSINVRKVSSEDSVTSKCFIELNTNVGQVTLPIDIWDGRLEVKHHFAPTSNLINHDVSIIYTGLEDGPVTRTLSLYNPNPVTVKIRKFDSLSPYISARVIGVSSSGANNDNFYKLSSDHKSFDEAVLPSGEIPVPPCHFALVEVFANATEPPIIDSLTNVLMWVVTDQPNRTPIVGSILFDGGNYFSEPDPVVMQGCFPGAICQETLRVWHTYRSIDPYRFVKDEDIEAHQLQFIDFLPDDTGFSYEPLDDNFSVYYREKTKASGLYILICSFPVPNFD